MSESAGVTGLVGVVAERAGVTEGRGTFCEPLLRPLVILKNGDMLFAQVSGKVGGSSEPLITEGAMVLVTASEILS